MVPWSQGGIGGGGHHLATVSCGDWGDRRLFSGLTTGRLGGYCELAVNGMFTQVICMQKFPLWLPQGGF